MDDTNRAALYYKYPFSQKITTYLLMPVASLITIGLSPILLKANSPILGSLFILFGAGLLFLSAFGSLICSSIIVSNDGIAAHNFGRTLRIIRWENVTKIKKVRRWNAASRSFEDTFYIFDGDMTALNERMVNFRGPVAFSDRIRGVRNLLNEVSEYGRRHHLLLVALDQQNGSEEFRVTDFRGPRSRLISVDAVSRQISLSNPAI